VKNCIAVLSGAAICQKTFGVLANADIWDCGAGALEGAGNSRPSRQGDPGYTPRKFLKLHMPTDAFQNILNTNASLVNNLIHLVFIQLTM
jgi:hypothetical protein